MADDIVTPQQQPQTTRAGVEKPQGPISAAIIAAGIGAAALGVVTTLAEASESFRDWLSWNDEVGPLSGKTIVAVAVWLVSWLILHAVLRRKPNQTRGDLAICLLLLLVGLIGTFPTFFQAFAPD